MGKKVREYKSGDFIFAKVKGYPAWPARVQRLNGKKYFVYFYGTGETANLPPNMIFDYAENKDKFLTKTVKRRDFNDGVKQIEHDFANNVPLEQVIGALAEPPADAANDTANDTANETMDDSAIADTTTADESMTEESNMNTSQNAVEDSDEAGALVIDEGKKGRKSKAAEPAKTPAKAKEPKTPRGKAKKEEPKDEEEEKKDEEIVSRSGRKIRPKRYIDEQTEDNATLPSPMPKKRRGASPPPEKESEKEKPNTVKDKPAAKLYNAVTQSELEDLKEPFKQEDAEKDNILITYLPSGQYVGIKLFQSRPNSFKNESARLSWDKQSAANAVTLKLQLERGQITPQSVVTQLVMDLNLTDEEKAALDKERETEEKKCRVQFLKTEMKLIELDAKIKTCLCLEKADTELCLKLLDELMELEVKPLMLLKHPSCLETVKRMRAYVGNTPSWDLSESEALLFSKQAHKIRKQADTLYNNMRTLFTTPDGLSFWESFSDRVVQFKKATAKLTPDELLELVHEPLEMTMPTTYTMKAAIDAANEEEPPEDESITKKKGTPAKAKKAANSTPSKPALKRQSSRKQPQEEKDKEKESKKVTEDKTESSIEEEAEKPVENNVEKEPVEENDVEMKDSEADNGKEVENDVSENSDKDKSKDLDKDKNKAAAEKEKPTKEVEKEKNKKEVDKEKNKDSEKSKKELNKNSDKEKTKKDSGDKESDKNKKDLEKEKNKKDTEKNKKDSVEKEKKESPENENAKEAEKEKNKESAENVKSKDVENNKDSESESSADKSKTEEKSEKKSEKKDEKNEEESKEDDKDISEPRAKRSRESKKSEPPPPRSPAKRKSKF